MHLFSSYIQPLTDWLKIHTNWALFITFIISFSESLAIIGSIVPGSITMTAIGILAGSGIMRVDLTYLSAVLGAIAGDSLSYLLGFFYSDQLVKVWPLKKYPQWLVYGKNYFSRHGGKSVLIGRFIGPLRSLIPVIAGMMHMDHWRFLVANIVSAAGWAFLYVTPGIIIGAASSELSPESATELFVFILILVGTVWLLGTGVRWILSRLAKILRSSMHNSWKILLSLPKSGFLFAYFTPTKETDYSNTAFTFINLLFAIIGFYLTLMLIENNNIQLSINEPAYLFLQSLHTIKLDIIAIIITHFISSITLLSLTALIGWAVIYKRDLRTLLYWVSLNLSCVSSALIFNYLFMVLPPNATTYFYWTSVFPNMQLLVGVAQFSALICFFNKKNKDKLSYILITILLILILAVSLSLLYLGDNWLLDIIGTLFLSLSIFLVHWLFYRRHFLLSVDTEWIKLILSCIMLSSCLSIAINFNKIKAIKQVIPAHFITSEADWLSQRNLALPVYRANRVGKLVSLFNFQYVGDLKKLELSLIKYGWKIKNESFIRSLLERISDRRLTNENPLLSQLYLNRTPALIMTYRPKVQPGLPMQTLRVWQSNVHIMHYDSPIWIGTISFFNDINRTLESNSNSLKYVEEAVSNDFFRKKIALPGLDDSQVLLVKEPDLLNNN